MNNKDSQMVRKNKNRISHDNNLHISPTSRGNIAMKAIDVVKSKTSIFCVKIRKRREQGKKRKIAAGSRRTNVAVSTDVFCMDCSRVFLDRKFQTINISVHMWEK